MIIDIAPGLWIWRQDHPDWTPEADYDPPVTCTVVEAGGEVIAIDPLVPDDPAVQARLDAKPPSIVAILKPDHVRAVDAYVERYGARPYGPHLFWPHDVPQTKLNRIDPDDTLPGGLLALWDDRHRMETPVYLHEQRTLVFADAMTAPHGELLIWNSPWHETRVVPGMRKLLELDFERVIVSHGEPVHDRAAFEAALERPPHGEIE